MRIEEIYKNLVSQKKVKKGFVLYCYNTKTGDVEICARAGQRSDMECYIESRNLTSIPYSLFMAEGKRLKQYLSKSRY